MKKIFQQLLFLICLTSILVLPYFVFANSGSAEENTANPLDKLEEVGATAGPYIEANPNTFSFLLGDLVRYFLSLLGIIFISLMIYAGYHWMTAHGEEEKVNKAKNTIKNAIIGLVITVSAYVIWDFIFTKLIL